MDDLRLLDDLVRADPLPTKAELGPARADLVGAMAPVAPAWRPRLLAGFALVGTATAAALAVAALSVPTKPSPTPPVAVAPTAPETPHRAAFRLVADSPQTTQATARRLTEEFDAALRAAAPDARWIRVPGRYPAGGPPRIKGWEQGKAAAGGPMFNGAGAVGRGDRWGSLGLLVESDGTLLRCASDQPDCVVSTGPGGATLVRLTDTTPGMPTTGDPHVQLQARVGLPDGRVLVVVHSNDIGPDGTPRTRWRTPLALSQIVAVATDIAARIRG